MDTQREGRGRAAAGAAMEPGEVLLGLVFATVKELRHQAELLLGRLFVPTEVVEEGERFTDVVLRPDGMDEIHVHAERQRQRYPFHVTRVEHVTR
jgi:hypothetical protein